MAQPTRIVITREPDGYHIAAYFANQTISHVRGLPSWIGFLKAKRWNLIPRKVA